MLWIGERTRDLDGAHVEFLRGVGNPIGCKVGPDVTATSCSSCARRSTRRASPGRLTLITRMGADAVEDRLRPLLRAVTDAGPPVVWACDPMHGNTFSAPSGRKTRHFDDIVARSPGSCGPTWPRARGRAASTSSSPARTSPSASAAPTRSPTPTSTTATRRCATPGLNGRQSLDLAFRVAELIAGDVA